MVQISYAQYINLFTILSKETMMSYDLALMLKLVCILKKKSIVPKKYLTTKKLYNSWDLSNMYKNRCIISHLIFILFHSLRKEIIEYWLSFCMSTYKSSTIKASFSLTSYVSHSSRTILVSIQWFVFSTPWFCLLMYFFQCQLLLYIYK